MVVKRIVNIGGNLTGEVICGRRREQKKSLLLSLKLLNAGLLCVAHTSSVFLFVQQWSSTISSSIVEAG